MKVQAHGSSGPLLEYHQELNPKRNQERLQTFEASWSFSRTFAGAILRSVLTVKA